MNPCSSGGYGSDSELRKSVLEIHNIVTVNIGSSSNHTNTCLVVGVGNTLLRDDGIGIHIANSLRQDARTLSNCEIIDGGTIGLALLPEVEDADSLVIVDAAEIGEAPGSVRVFHDEEVDRHLSGKLSHVVSMVDGVTPSERASRPS